jgi:hypothetical protein
VDANLAVVAGVSASLLGIGLAVVSILPLLFDVVASRGGRLEQRLSASRFRRYFIAVGLSTTLFGISTVSALLGLSAGSCIFWPIALVLCIVGICVLVAACCLVLVEFVADLGLR